MPTTSPARTVKLASLITFRSARSGCQTLQSSTSINTSPGERVCCGKRWVMSRPTISRTISFSESPALASSVETVVPSRMTVTVSAT